LDVAFHDLARAQSLIPSAWLSKQGMRKMRGKNGRRHQVDSKERGHLSEGCSLILQQTGVQEGRQQLERKEKEREHGSS